jgi:hypothetical protein
MATKTANEELLTRAGLPTELALVLYALVGLGRDIDGLVHAVEVGDAGAFGQACERLHAMYAETAKRGIEALGQVRPEASAGLASALQRALDKQCDKEQRARRRAERLAAVALAPRP